MENKYSIAVPHISFKLHGITKFEVNKKFRELTIL